MAYHTLSIFPLKTSWWLPLLAIISRAAMNIRMQFSFLTEVFNLLSKFLKAPLISFSKPFKLSSEAAVSFFIPASSEWEFLLLHILASFGVVSILDFRHSDGCVVVAYMAAPCIFICELLKTYDYLLYVYFLWWGFCLDLLSFFIFIFLIN